MKNGATYCLPCLILLVGLLGCSNASSGREGNALYEQEKYAEAAEAFSKGIVELDPESDQDFLSRYYNNLGAALHRSENFQQSQDAFVQSAASADDNDARSRAHYNAGNNAYRMNQNKLATDFYMQSLISQPEKLEAKINYEFVRRKLDQEQQDGQEQETPEPSEYAKDLKRQAEELVAQRRYREAYQLMDEGRQIDPTVEAFGDFIQRISSVADINELPA